MRCLPAAHDFFSARRYGTLSAASQLPRRHGHFAMRHDLRQRERQVASRHEHAFPLAY